MTLNQYKCIIYHIKYNAVGFSITMFYFFVKMVVKLNIALHGLLIKLKIVLFMVAKRFIAIAV